MMWNHIGIDEVGRGPLAGPLAVCAFLLCGEEKKGAFHGIRDSKKLSLKAREAWFQRLICLRKEGSVDWRVAFVTAPVIDRMGMAYALRTATARAIRGLHISRKDTKILLDAGLRAPDEYVHQKAYVRGDERFKVIAAASIVAKVLRDRRMVRYGKKYPEYGFQLHKGYGTDTHLKAIRRHGVCILHRKTFLA